MTEKPDPGGENCRGESVISPGDVISFELVLRYPPAKQARIDQEARQLLAGVRPGAHDTAVADRSADPADIEKVRAFVTHAGLTIDSVRPDLRVIRVSGRADTVGRLFGVTLTHCRKGDISWRAYQGQLRLPPELDGVAEPLGLSTKPIAERVIAQPDSP